MKAYPCGISVRIADRTVLESLLLSRACGFTQVQLPNAGIHAKISGIQTDQFGNVTYTLVDILGIWPQLSLIPYGRPLTVNFAKPSRPRRGATPNRDHSHPGPSELYVGNTPYGMRDTSLLRLFLRCGEVATVDVIRDSFSGRSKGFGYVAMASVSAAAHAIAEINGKEVLENGEYVAAYTQAAGADHGEEPFADRLAVVEIIESVSRRLAAVICEDPGKLQELEWRDLERMLAVVLDGLGYVVSLTNGAKDGGKDIVLQFVACHEAQSYYVEVKHWVSGKRVGRAPVREFLSVIARDGQDGGILISTSGFSTSAVQGLTEIERLRLGDSNTVVSLCRTYLGVSNGLMRPVDQEDMIHRATCAATERAV